MGFQAPLRHCHGGGVERSVALSCDDIAAMSFTILWRSIAVYFIKTRGPLA